MIEQSKSNVIQINSSGPVFRRYSEVEDLLKVALTVKPGGEVIESGGELIEIEDLAKLIVDDLELGAKIVRSNLTKDSDHYHSDNGSWMLATAAAGIQPKSLRKQIASSALALLQK